MIRMFRLLFVLLLCNFVYGQNRNSSAPFISGDTFRAACDFIYDETTKEINYKNVGYGSTFFVKTDYIAEFFRHVHPHIRYPYVLVTHNSDFGAPGACRKFLNDPKLLAWYGQNVELSHPKLHPIPIGIANQCWLHGNVDLLKQVQELSVMKSHLLYLNFTQSTYPERTKVYELFKNIAYVYLQTNREYENYLLDVASSKFTLSPRGNGLDCHRTWEALWLGSIPILKSSMMNPLLEGLPVLIVEEWTDISETLLQKKWAEHLLTQYNLEKLYFDYWLKEINQFKDP